jgi:hypothetical protein
VAERFLWGGGPEGPEGFFLKMVAKTESPAGGGPEGPERFFLFLKRMDYLCLSIILF